MLDHEGLQIATEDGLEISPEQKLWAPLERRSSWDRPERYVGGEDAPEKFETGEDAPLQLAHSPSLNDRKAEEDCKWQNEAQTTEGKAKRYCGLKKRTAIWALAAVLLFAIIAAVLGAVIPLTLRKNSSSQSHSSSSGSGPSGSATNTASGAQPTSTSSQNQSFGGVALIANGDGHGTTFGYYQDSNNTIRERTIQGGVWSGSSDTVVASVNVAPNTPIAAAAVTDSGSIVWRFIFFLDDQTGQLMMKNRSTSGQWSGHTAIAVPSDDSTAPSDIALDAISIHIFSLNGIRLRYGSAHGDVREVGFGGAPYADKVWDGISRAPFANGSDAASGVGQTIYNGTYHVYVRDPDSGALNKWVLKFTNDGVTTNWNMNAVTGSDAPPVAKGSDITACSDLSGAGTTGKSATDYIFYQTTNGSLVKVLSLTDDSSNAFSNYQVLPQAVLGSKFRAMYNNGSADNEGARAMLFYQPHNNAGLSYLEVNRNGQILANSTIQLNS